MLNLDAPPRTYLDLLRDELRGYEAKRARASEMLRGNEEYREKVLKGWDHAIGVKLAQIEREEQKATIP